MKTKLEKILFKILISLCLLVLGLFSGVVFFSFLIGNITVYHLILYVLVSIYFIRLLLV
jgi:hypothetical protein